VARYYILRIRPGWVATPSPDTPGHSALRSLSEATNCEQPRARIKLGVLFCDDSRRVSIKYCCSRLCFTMSTSRPARAARSSQQQRFRLLERQAVSLPAQLSSLARAWAWPWQPFALSHCITIMSEFEFSVHTASKDSKGAYKTHVRGENLDFRHGHGSNETGTLRAGAPAGP
jgi:hypothetical protein